MSIEDAARKEAERRWPSPNTGLYEGLIIGFRHGAVWAREQADREPSDAEVRRAAHAMAAWKKGRTGAPAMIDLDMARAALLAAQEVRRG